MLAKGVEQPTRQIQQSSLNPPSPTFPPTLPSLQKETHRSSVLLSLLHSVLSFYLVVLKSTDLLLEVFRNMLEHHGADVVRYTTLILQACVPRKLFGRQGNLHGKQSICTELCKSVCVTGMMPTKTEQVPAEALHESVHPVHAAVAALLAAHIHRIACSTLRLAPCPLHAAELHPHNHYSTCDLRHMSACSAARLRERVVVSIC